MLRQTQGRTRFRCGHCGYRLVMHNRHLRRRVACHGCGRATHPVDAEQRLTPPAPAAQTINAPIQHPEIAAVTPPAAPSAVAADRPVHSPAMLELSAAPLAPLLLIGVTAGAFFAAISLMSYLGGFVSALLLVAAAAAGLRWLKRGTLSIRARLDQIDAMRLRHGSLRVSAMLLAWLWSQPGRRKPWAGLLMLFWAGLYAPYYLGALLLPAPRGRIARTA